MKRIIAMALIITGCALMFVNIGYYALSQWSKNPDFEALPDRLAGYQLVDEVTGSQTVSEISQLHILKMREV